MWASCSKNTARHVDVKSDPKCLSLNEIKLNKIKPIDRSPNFSPKQVLDYLTPYSKLNFKKLNI